MNFAGPLKQLACTRFLALEPFLDPWEIPRHDCYHFFCFLPREMCLICCSCKICELSFAKTSLLLINEYDFHPSHSRTILPCWGPSCHSNAICLVRALRRTNRGHFLKSHLQPQRLFVHLCVEIIDTLSDLFDLPSLFCASLTSSKNDYFATTLSWRILKL